MIFIALFLSFLVTLIVPAYAQNQTQTQAWSTYEDPILGVSVRYPSGWETER